MANEATLIYETELPIPMTCAEGTGIEKGCFLDLADPYTVSAQSGQNDIVGGIAAEEKIASDGKTKIAVYRGGIFKVYCSGSITAGHPVVWSKNANEIAVAGTNEENIAGIALETGADGETIYFELRPTTMQLA